MLSNIEDERRRVNERPGGGERVNPRGPGGASWNYATFVYFMNKMQTQIAQNLGGIWSNLELQIVKGTQMHEITTQIPRSPINNVTISL